MRYGRRGILGSILQTQPGYVFERLSSPQAKVVPEDPAYHDVLGKGASQISAISFMTCGLRLDSRELITQMIECAPTVIEAEVEEW